MQTAIFVLIVCLPGYFNYITNNGNKVIVLIGSIIIVFWLMKIIHDYYDRKRSNQLIYFSFFLRNTNNATQVLYINLERFASIGKNYIGEIKINPTNNNNLNKIN